MKNKNKYKNSKKIDNSTKKFLMYVFIVFFIIIILNLILHGLEKRQTNLSNESQNEFSSIEGILDFYGCTYIKEEKSKENDTYGKIYLRFKYMPIENKASQKSYYESIIIQIAELVKKDFNLIDSEKSLEIKVSVDTKNESVDYVVNNEVNYFDKQLSKIELDKFDTQTSNLKNFIINSPELLNVNSNKWKKNGVDFGKIDSTFKNYNIYFDKGIKVRNISDEIFNIVFTKKYNGPIVNDLKVGDSISKIVETLGEPSFGTKVENTTIGYKGKDLYVFFSNDSISVYKNKSKDLDKFQKILDDYLNNKYNIKTFINELTYLWDDYEEYTYNDDSIYLSYPNNGIEIDISSSSNSSGIVLYSNCNISEELRELINDGKIKFYSNMDLVYKTQNKQENDRREIIFKASAEAEQDVLSKTQSKAYYCYYNDKERILDFIAKSEQYMDRSVNEKISDGMFISDTNYLYSINGKGIFIIDVMSNERKNILTGEDDYIINNFSNNVLTYNNDKKIELNLE